MSYILEALKKSDRERQRNTVPDLQTHHALPPRSLGMRRRPGRKKRVLIAFLVTLSLFTVGILLIWERFPISLRFDVSINSSEQDSSKVIRQENQPPPRDESPAIKENKTANATPASETRPEPEVQSEQPATVIRKVQSKVTYQPAPLLAVDSTESQKTPAIKTATIQEDFNLADNDLPLLDNMPKELLAGLPDLKYAGHTYSESSDRRLIIINNNIRKEGDLIASGLRLEEITWEGVVLDYHGNKFLVITTN